jgi:AcrR family transcriptional regulator
MGIKERKERKKDEIRSAILEESLKLFHEEGYANITMRQIAKKIEYSPTTIYLYFKNKDEIFYELHNLGFEKFSAAQESLLTIKDPFERLIEHAKKYIQFAIENQEYYDIMFIMRNVGLYIKEEKDWSQGTKTYNFLRMNVEDCMKAGYFGGQSLDVIVFSMWSYVHGIASLIIRGRCINIPESQLSILVQKSVEFIHDLSKLTYKKS